MELGAYYLHSLVLKSKIFEELHPLKDTRKN
jgi:hypothetical protein